MRITSEVMVSRSLHRLQNRLSSYERTQSELATGRRILKPSDDPSGARRSASLSGSMRAAEQHQRNASDANGWLANADNQLQSAMNRLQRARDLATRGATETTPAERETLAVEIDAIREELVGIANATHSGRSLFGGFTAGPAVEQGADGTWITRGAGDEVTRRVSDSEQVRVNVTAQEWLGFADPDTPDVLTALDTLAADLRSGAPISGHLTTLDAAAGRLGDSLAVVGAATNRVASAESRAEDLAVTLRTELSEVQDVDVAEGVMELKVQEVAYEATLAALGRALPPSLAAFLR